MGYNKKDVLTDRHGRYFPQYYDESSGDFKVQPKIATEETLKKVLYEYREPPVLKNVKMIQDENVRTVHWFHDGLFYGSNPARRTIYTSPDGVNWTELHTFPEGVTKRIAFIIVSDTNRIIVGLNDKEPYEGGTTGEVYISDENGNFNTTPDITTGTFDYRFGQSKHGSIICINTYVLPQGVDAGQKLESFISTDDGATFKKIFDTDTFNTLPGFIDGGRVHIHDTEYDPYSGRIYVWTGDFNDRTLNYSDDWGATWKMAFPRGQVDNATQIIATRDGIALAADTGGGGLSYVHLDRSRRINPEISLKNYDGNFWKFDDPNNRYIACRKWVDREKGIFLIPYLVEYDDNNERSAYLAYSKDGYNWQSIYKSPHKGHYSGWHTITYGNGLIVGTYQGGEYNQYIFIAEADL